MNCKHLTITIYGDVQGVNFRASALNKAYQLDINGYARNKQDGAVHIEAEGDSKNLEEFVRWCRTGPAFAQVKKIVVVEGSLNGFRTFSIRRL